jgi:mannan endo-1,4-beta-mannosidase
MSYAGVKAFTAATGVRPNVLMYYSSWNEPFQSGFAEAAARRGAVPLVQMNPYGVSLGDIASGRYDGYLSTFASAIRSYHRPVILSFGHEMNGYWYPWGYKYTSPAVFVDAWRHIVTLFRSLDAGNVTWLWTVNIIQTNGGIRSPLPWWPGNSYVDWVGIDGYYSTPASTFSSLFGPTIGTVREMTRAPILVSETAVAPVAGQATKIPDLFAGIRLYGLLGLVWFNVQDWHINGPAAIAALRQGAGAYQRPAP